MTTVAAIGPQLGLGLAQESMGIGIDMCMVGGSEGGTVAQRARKLERFAEAQGAGIRHDPR